MIIRVKVQARSKVDKITAISKDKFLVQTQEPAKEGRANTKVKFLLADYFRLPLSKVRLLRGHHQPNKLFEIYINDHQRSSQ